MLLSYVFTHESSYCFQRILALAILSVGHMGGSIKNSASWDYKIFTFGCLDTLVLGTVKIFHKFKGFHPERRC